MNSENNSHIVLAQAIREEIRQPIPVEIFDSTWRDANPDDLGEYDGYTEITEKFGLPNKIGIYDQLDNRSFEVVTLHEGIHALTIMRYKTDPIFRNKINNLFQHVKDYAYVSKLENILNETTESIKSLEKMGNTLLKDEYEFISEALTNSEYQELLSTIPAYDESNIKDLSKSVFRQFIESIFDLLSNFFARHPESINDLPQSAFKELISLVDDTLIRPNEVLDNLDLNKTAEENEITIFSSKRSNKQNNEFELSKETNIVGKVDLVSDKKEYVKRLELISYIKNKATPEELSKSLLMKQVTNTQLTEDYIEPNIHDLNLTSLFLYGKRYNELRDIKYKSDTRNSRSIMNLDLDNLTEADLKKYTTKQLTDEYERRNTVNDDPFEDMIDDLLKESAEDNIATTAGEQRDMVKSMAHKYINFPEASSEGGLFDLVNKDLITPEEAISRTIFGDTISDISNNIFKASNNPVREFFTRDIFNMIEKSAKFQDLYPDYSYLTILEQEAMDNAIRLGEIQLACGI
jgi:hypothetical protein